jgi:hypothetical protein
MEIHLNPRDNGACPLCTKIDACPVRGRITDSVAEIRDPSSQGMEIVIYTCPLFKERF